MDSGILGPLLTLGGIVTHQDHKQRLMKLKECPNFSICTFFRLCALLRETDR